MSSESTMVWRLNRTTHPAPRAEARIVHIGLGAFHRAHQAWYTAQANDGWGIAAFTGRSATAANELSSQDGLYTLVTRQAQEDSFEVIGSIVQAHDAADLNALSNLLASPSVGIITLTITEAGYKLDPRAETPSLDLNDVQVGADLQTLRASYEGGVFAQTARQLGELQLATVPARLVVALAARRAADGWPIALVSCDNLPDNGKVARAGILGLARQVDVQLAEWIEANVSFVDTSIDRITPRLTAEDRTTVAAATGFEDCTPVVTEPFSSWVIAGEFPAGRPAWEKAGAQFVQDLGPFERRKLWLLNGAHTLMSFAGQLRGHQTVAQALADATISDWVEEFWDAAAAHLTEPELNIAQYRQALRTRFENPRIAHFLQQIAMDGSIKLAARAVPVYQAERRAGRNGQGALRLFAAWCEQLAAQHATAQEILDPQAAKITEVLADTRLAPGSIEQTQHLVALIDENLAQDLAVITQIHALRSELTN